MAIREQALLSHVINISLFLFQLIELIRKTRWCMSMHETCDILDAQQAQQAP